MIGEALLHRVAPGEDVARPLAELLVDCVESGASVGFMNPLTLERAEAFWTAALDSAARGERIVIVAREPGTGAIVGTVQVVLAAPENQPHRGEIAKLQVLRRWRRRGLADALMDLAERAAWDAGKTLLVLDTASDDAERLYERRDWQRVGLIPRYALWPDGGYADTIVFYKDLAAGLYTRARGGSG